MDIEADAQRLRDELNICEQAVDYFRASSALLKAGVKAGLTLYDIAILCCRNDNLAEVPSMMEKLFSMASELAHAAVENERWHHSAASRAIVEQLTPHHRRMSLLTTGSNSSLSRRMCKSVSTDMLASFHSASSSESIASPPFIAEDAPPEMARSSASDSSSDDPEDCEEWAAGVIADISVDQIVPCRPHRAASIGSDDGSNDSNEQRGFWYVRPGAASPAASDDEGSYAWSPQSTPRSSLHVTDELPDLSLEPKTPTVTFAAMPSGPFIPPATVDIGYSKVMAMKPDMNAMPRSKSYSSLPRGRGASKPTKQQPYENDNYRKYFHKFIDLVIVRETTAALKTTNA